MSPESIITSAESKQRWLRATGANFDLPHIVDMPFCVFKVPKKLSDAKPEAYIPRRLGLGPYHHLRPEFHAINKRKLVAIRNFYAPEIFQNIRVLVGYLVKLEPVIRAYYDQFLDLDIEMLAWIIAIDGLYLLQYLKKYPEMKDVAGDVLMLENQIPMQLLKIVRRFVKLFPTGDASLVGSIQAFLEGRSPLELGPTDDKALLYDFQSFKLIPAGEASLSESVEKDVSEGPELGPADDEPLLEDFRPFLRDQSPLELYPEAEETNCAHLLHQMYSLIRGSRVVITPLSPHQLGMAETCKMSESSLEVVAKGTQVLDALGVPGAGTASQVLSFANAIPREEISGMFKKDGPDPDPDPSVTVNEIDIPSITQMAEVAGFKFVHTEGGIRDVRFDNGGGESKAERIVYLPSIKITATTEIVLRNLVAFEALAALPGATLELAEYVDLMCGIIDTRRDVEILREAGIVHSDLDDDEIARIFNGINRSEKTKEKKEKEEEKSGVEETVERVNATYNSLMRVKMEKLAGKYGQGCLKVMRLAATIVVVLMLTLQAYCTVFGCSRWFGKSSS